MKCALCLQNKKLHKSHMIPRFVSNWLKTTSPTGYLRAVTEPNIRKQDLFKKKLLCFECEQLFSGLELYFAKTIFYPFINRNKQTFEYDERLKKFIVSVQWRMVLLEFIDSKKTSLSLIERFLLKRFLNSARSYLLGKSKEIPYEQHITFLGEISSMPQDQVPPRFHQYLLRSVDSTPVLDTKKRLIPKTVWHFVKFPHVALITFIKPISNNDWIGTKIEKFGILNAKQEIRDGRYGRFLIDRARMANDMFKAGISQDQMGKIIKSAEKNPEKILKSKTFQAWRADKKIGSKYD